jgi:ABC-type branched-subunit amino acid transport system ATPase component
MTPVALEVRDLVVRYGGLVAVGGVSLRAAAGTVTGLIGPNGAGKTTTFDATTGVVVPASGTVRLGDRCLDGLGVMARAQAGLGRTFQKMELCDSMTVRENVALGPEMVLAGRRPWRHLWGTRGERAEVAARADDAVARCGIGDLAERRTADLSTGQRRLVELARAIASPFRFLLLDEPSSGLDPTETEHFVAILADLVERTGTGILIVEHDMALVRALCSYIYVLDFGKLIFEGPTSDALSSEIVKAAYLGSEAVQQAVTA